MTINIEGKLVSDTMIEQIVSEIQARLAAKEDPVAIWADIQSKINNL